MPDYLFAFFFDDDDQVGVTGLTGTIDISNVVTGASAEAGLTPVEVGDGVYSTVRTLPEADYIGVMKTAANGWRASLSVKEIPRIDVSVSSRLADSDWVTGLASILAEIAGIPALVWAWASRTLTMTAAQILAVLTGSTLTITNRVTFSQEISNLTIPATWEKIFVTFKKSRDYPDGAAALQWVVSNPAAASTDGIAVYAGTPGGTSRTLGALTVDQPGGKITIGLQDDIDLALLAGDYDYDIKCLLADGSSQILSEAQGVIKLAVTRAVEV
jgi:hypothetical protein